MVVALPFWPAKQEKSIQNRHISMSPYSIPRRRLVAFIIVVCLISSSSFSWFHRHHPFDFIAIVLLISLSSFPWFCRPLNFIVVIILISPSSPLDFIVAFSWFYRRRFFYFIVGAHLFPSLSPSYFHRRPLLDLIVGFLLISSSSSAWFHRRRPLAFIVVVCLVFWLVGWLFWV